MSLIQRLPAALLCVAGGYLSLVISLGLFSSFQRAIIYLHRIRLPLFARFDKPTKYGYAPGKVRNFYLETRDGCRLGVWQVLPDDVYQTHITAHGFPLSLKDGKGGQSCLPASVFEGALQKGETVLYFHGNAATRAASNRVRVGRLMSRHPGRGFVVVDYRGFADSTGTPSEDGLLVDARTAWDYLMGKGATPGQVIVMGQSLGTGVSVGLVASLAREGVAPKAMILVAPFSSIPSLLASYKLAGIPLLRPLLYLPGAMTLLNHRLETKFNSHASITSISSPILLLHARNDSTIPWQQSVRLFEQLGGREGGSEEPRGDWGVVRRLERPGRGRVVLGLARTGDHNDIGSEEGTLMLIEEMLVLT